MTRGRLRFPWFALLMGLVLGIAGGLYYAWFLNPVSLVNIAPNQLNPADRQAYILLIGEAYLKDQDAERARERLAALGERDVVQLAVSQADTAFLRGDDPDEVCALTTLAEALGGQPLAADVICEQVASPTPPAETPTITPTFEGMPTLTPSPALPTLTWTPFIPTLTPTRVVIVDTGFGLISRVALCEQSRRTGLIQVFVYDALEVGVPGVGVSVEWAGGSEIFFTGLKPEIEPGYADFRMEPDMLYTVTLVGLSEPVAGIDSSDCRTDTGELVTPTIQLIFGPVEETEEE
jgi:hypothetical protein